MNILLVRKKSAYELYATESGEKAAKYIAESQDNAKELEESFKRQKNSLDVIESILRNNKQHYELVSRADAPDKLQQHTYDLIICLGGDGTFLEVSHFVTDTLMWGINADPECSVGFYTATTADTFENDWNNFQSLPQTNLPRGRVCINKTCFNEQFVNNMLLAGKSPMQTARFSIETTKSTQTYIRNSGLLVCAAGGSTAWMHQLNGKIMSLDDKRFQYVVREVKGELPQFTKALKIMSLTHDAIVYLDTHKAFYDVDLGDVIEVTQGSPLRVIGDINSKQKTYK